MARLSLKTIEERVESLGNRENYDREFIFELLDVFGKPKATITRLRSGSINIAQDKDKEVGLKNTVYFRESADALAELQTLRTEPHVIRYNPRFIITTDFVELVALDMKTGENLLIPIRDIAQHFIFFLPWAGMEKAQYAAESHADVKAAERMGKLFDELLRANPDLTSTDEGRHGFNVFFTRLLFCYFAEDTGIFKENQFTNAVGSHTHTDGSDTREFLAELFLALDTPNVGDKPSYLSGFPYVNGRLFSKDAPVSIPTFTKHAREILIQLGTLLWQEINPDIFGSMFQAIVKSEQRSDLGQHYTSVPNILKTIEPLFLDELKQLFDAGYDSPKQLTALLARISQIKVFDPACGSGNFLIIAYKELRKLEHAILGRLAELDPAKYSSMVTTSLVNIENFYGIEIDDFATEVAILSLWIAKHQMNKDFEDKFGVAIPLIPLKETGQIRAGNACRIDWNEVCPNNGSDEIYLISNPPYGGSKKLEPEQKEDYDFIFGSEPYNKNLDYVALWFIKGARYIQGSLSKVALVATNSISQGEHVSLMFPYIFNLGVEIGFAYASFKWENNAKRNAGVTVVVIGLRNKSDDPRFIFDSGISRFAQNINGYLSDAPNVEIVRRKSNFNEHLPKMAFGSMPRDGGNLILSESEFEQLVSGNKEVLKFIKKFIGAEDFIKGNVRYCLWIEDNQVEDAMGNAFIRQRLDRVRRERAASKASSTRSYADRSHRFVQISYKQTDSIIVPSVSSERREYIPIGYLDSNTVISNLAFAIYDAEPWLFSLLTSKMHMVWVRAVGGQLETRLRYSNTIVYNNFPVPPLSDEVKEALTKVALRVLDVREYHCDRTLAELYDREKMPQDLREAHHAVDKLVDSLYGEQVFDDESRLSTLFAMYEEYIEREAQELLAKKSKGKKK
ncbi:DNA methyltransferase [Corynebacterium epidermidicanis]|uniref:DNA methyltransferase n=1 Tax=Corynebacterium epidermidicanis TaxID=1050174 RepID=UPI00064165DD|nr:DNA methyltransferase [Corynebacterium epidermidicanis]